MKKAFIAGNVEMISIPSCVITTSFDPENDQLPFSPTSIDSINSGSNAIEGA